MRNTKLQTRYDCRFLLPLFVLGVAGLLLFFAWFAASSTAFAQQGGDHPVDTQERQGGDQPREGHADQGGEQPQDSQEQQGVGLNRMRGNQNGRT